MTGGSKPVPPSTPAPSGPPAGPSRPTPTGPRPRGAHSHPARRIDSSAAVGAEAITTPGGLGFTFTEGEHRLVGRVGGPAHAEATVLASLMAAARTNWPGEVRPLPERIVFAPYEPKP